MGSSYFGHGTDMIPAMFALGFGLPGLSSTSLGNFKGLIEKVIQWSTEPYIYHFPDGNASIARLLVRSLIDGVAPGSSMQDIMTAPFDYAKLDAAASPVRLRLSSTVIEVAHDGPAAIARRVNLTYLNRGKAYRVGGKQVVLACYNMAIPHICQELPEQQKQALAKLVKVSMCSTNVLLHNRHAIKQAGIGMVYSPDDPIMMHCLRGVTGRGTTPEEQSRNGRYELLARTFDDYEREIRRHLAGMLGASEFDPGRDIAAITVNCWPHGYAWNPNPLFNTDYEAGQAPHEIGRQPFGRISIANSDAGARAYLDCAIDEASRAVSELA